MRRPEGSSAAQPRPGGRTGGRTAGPPTLLCATKAETLAALAPVLRGAVVPPLVHFSVDEWHGSRPWVLRRLRERFAGLRVAVRSSAHDEDARGRSRAGHYRTRLDVPCAPRPLASAVDWVIASYDGKRGDRVLVQAMVRDVRASGVLATRDPATGVAYDVLECADEGAATDAVTGGTLLPRRIVVHRDAPRRALPLRVRRLLAVARRIERLAGCSGLEIELAEARDGTLSVLQVRPLPRPAAPPALDRAVAARLAGLADVVAERARPSRSVAGTWTILGQMPDWNPAELLGVFPLPLAFSVFGFLIGDGVWQEARAALGYRPVPGEPLLALLAGRPFVDVRLSFNSFLPAGLDPSSERTLVDAWLARLAHHPELHDEVELEVAQTALDLDFERTHRARFGRLLGASAHVRYVAALRALTGRLLALGSRATLARALDAVERLGRAEPARAACARPAARALAILGRCRREGTLPFAVIARHAFVADALLRSAVHRGALAPERAAAVRASCGTVAGDVARALAAATVDGPARTAFLARYGHLRPGTFDVTSRRYDQRRDLLSGAGARPRAAAERPRFALLPNEEAALDRLLGEARLPLAAAEMVRYARTAIAGRERAKLLFSRHLSAALEDLAAFGETLGLGRDDLAHLPLTDVSAAQRAPRPCAAARLRDRLAEARCAVAEERAIRLPLLIRGPDDVRVLPPEESAPTFVTTRSVSAATTILERHDDAPASLAGRVVCIESADPGFDWLFAYPIAGLVTCFGGGNSHMAIRCLELDIPAAIGVGERAFASIRRARWVELRCDERAVRCLCPDGSA